MFGEKNMTVGEKQYQVRACFVDGSRTFVSLSFYERENGKRKWLPIQPLCPYREIKYAKGSQSIDMEWLVKHLCESIPGMKECINSAIKALADAYCDKIMSFQVNDL